VAGAGTLITGFLGGLLALVAIGLAVAEPPRAAAIGGVLVGLGGAGLALFGRVALTCRDDCVSPDLRPWLLVAGILTGLGVLVTVRAVRAR
jgi:hypothetical protein